MLPCSLRPAALLLLGLAACLVPEAPARALDEVLDSVMYQDPDLPMPRDVKVFSAKLLPAWLRALEGPEADTRRLAAATIALAQRRGMPGLEAAVQPLRRVLEQPEQHPAVRLAAAQALVALDARTTADSLFRQAQAGGPELRGVVEPALARWDHPPARAAWLQRLEQPGTNGQDLHLAVAGLAAVREPRAVPRLRELVLAASANPGLRLDAARALGVIQTTGLEDAAERLAAEPAARTRIPHLLAAALVRHHRSDRAGKLLQRLAVDAEPAVTVLALEGLLDLDPRLVLPLRQQVAASPDAGARRLAVEAMRRCPEAGQLALLADLMDDPHPQVRRSARQVLLQQARAAGFDEAVRREATRLLAGTSWRGLEQAAILLTQLEHRPAAPRFVALLNVERPEVFVTAAWGLRKLALPETLPAMLQQVERQTPRLKNPEVGDPVTEIDLQVAQLVQALGAARYRPAAATLARFVPEGSIMGLETRAAAAWALGYIHEDKPIPSLAKQMVERLTDTEMPSPEDSRVRRSCAVALGRFKAREAMDALQMYWPGVLSKDPVGNACGWALLQMTGKPIPPPGTMNLQQRGWFLDVLE